MTVFDDIEVKEIRANKFGLAKAPVAAQSAIADAATTGATQTTPYGYTTAAQADAIITKLNLVLAALRASGIIAT